MQLKPSLKIAALAFVVISINACSSNVIPDLSRLYKTAELPSRSQETRSNNLQPPVILIHGAFGSRLNDRETNEEHWPGSLWRILFSDYEDIALSINTKSLMPTTSNLVATDVTDKVVSKPSLFARDALDPTIPRHRYSHFPLDYAMMLCESHDTLTGNIHFQDNLLNVLLTNDKP